MGILGKRKEQSKGGSPEIQGDSNSFGRTRREGRLTTKEEDGREKSSATNQGKLNCLK